MGGAWKEWVQIFLIIPLALALILLSQWSLSAGLFSGLFFGVGYFLSSRVLLDSPGFLDLSSFIRSTFLSGDPDFRLLPEEDTSSSSQCNHELTRHRASSCSICNSEDCARDKSCVAKPLPWQGLLIPKAVDYALLEFIELALRTYVHDWYFSEISDDQAFLIEIRYQIRYILANLYRKIQEKDLTEFIFSKIIPVAATHAEMYSKVQQHFGKDATPQMLEQRVLDFMRPAGGLHKTMYSRDSELAYLRSLADYVVSTLGITQKLDEQCPDTNRLVGDDKLLGTDLPAEKSNNPKYFLRDLGVFALFLPIMDTLADPDIINKVMILLFDPEPMRRFEEPDVAKVELLERLTVFSPNQAPDSLLQVKLKDMIRDQPLLYLFMNYLKTVRGPLNQLQFLLSAADWQQRYQDLKLEHLSEGRLEEEGEESGGGAGGLKEELSHLHWEAWELFRNYFQEGSPDQIAFPEDLKREFKSSVELGVEEAVRGLEKPVLKAHQLVYVWLQFSHMIPFCQSERFLEFLSGKRPELSADDLAEYASSRKSKRKLLGNSLNVVAISAQLKFPLKETAFSMAKLRTKFTGVFQTNVEEGSLITPSLSMDSSSGMGSTLSEESVTEPVRFLVEPAEVYPATDTGERAILLEEEDLIEIPGGIEGLSGSLDHPMEPDAESIDFEELLMERDFSQWKVCIPRVEPRRDESGRTMYVYVVQVIRNDLAESHPSRQWTVDRKYGEFYVLESKLLEFHGEAVVAPFLPPKKTFVNKGRAFVESLRPAFDGFVQRLAGSPVLKRSELLYMFLTSSQEFTSSLVPDAINPWKAMKKVPAKLSREKGQNLAKFLNNFLLSSEYSDSNPKLSKSKSCQNWGSSQELRSEHSGLSMMNLALEKQKVHDTIYNSIYGNNCDVTEERGPAHGRPGTFGDSQPLTRSTYDLILFLGAKVFLAAKWLFVSLVSVRIFMRDTVDSLIKVFVRRKLEMALCEQRVTELIELLRDTIFYEESTERTEEERRGRAEFAYRHSEEFLLSQIPKAAVQTVGEECMRKGLKQLFHCLQNPRMNKQLSYVLLDILLREVFPDMERVC